MWEKTEIGEHVHEQPYEMKEKIENTLCKLQELKERVEELKRKCKELRRMESERIECIAKKMSLCDKCGQTLDLAEQVIFRDPKGEERRHYHKECFQKLLK